MVFKLSPNHSISKATGLMPVIFRSPLPTFFATLGGML